MRPLVIIARPPFVEGALTVGKITEALSVEDFRLEGAVEPLFLALRLRMVRRARAAPDAEPHQPDGEAGIGFTAGLAPGRPVVHQHGQRQPVAAEGGAQLPAHRLALLIAASRQHNIVARVIVEHGERMAAAAAMHREVTLVVHLPKLVRARPLEALPRPAMSGRPGFRQPVVSAQDLGNRARRGHARLAMLLELPLDLAPTPDVVAEIAQPEHFGLHRRVPFDAGWSCGRREWSLRPSRPSRRYRSSHL